MSDPWRGYAYRRLSEALEGAYVVPFDDSSRIVFLSDCHRGDNSRADAFRVNEALYLHALDYYHREGYIYIEVGDGDDLWKNRRFADVQQAHAHVFDRLRSFEERGRLHLLFGNHDILDRRVRRLEKGGLVAHESLLLRHVRCGQQLLVLHGHQADFVSDRLIRGSRFLVRNFARRAQLLGLSPNRLLVSGPPPDENTRVEQRLTDWSQRNGQILICGHTHRPRYPADSAPPYFNTGSCIRPGLITGIEIKNGTISLVRWLSDGAAPAFRWEPLTPQRSLRDLRGTAC